MLLVHLCLTGMGTGTDMATRDVGINSELLSINVPNYDLTLCITSCRAHQPQLLGLRR